MNPQIHATPYNIIDNKFIHSKVLTTIYIANYTILLLYDHYNIRAGARVAGLLGIGSGGRLFVLLFVRGGGGGGGGDVSVLIADAVVILEGLEEVGARV